LRERAIQIDVYFTLLTLLADGRDRAYRSHSTKWSFETPIFHKVTHFSPVFGKIRMTKTPLLHSKNNTSLSFYLPIMHITSLMCIIVHRRDPIQKNRRFLHVGFRIVNSFVYEIRGQKILHFSQKTLLRQKSVVILLTVTEDERRFSVSQRETSKRNSAAG